AGQKEGEVFEPGPITGEQAAQKAHAGLQAIILKRDNQAEEWQVCEDRKPDGGGQAQQGQLGIVPCPAGLFALGELGRCLFFVFHWRLLSSVYDTCTEPVSVNPTC